MGGARRGPGGESGGGKPDEAGDELTGKASEESGADVALRIGNAHGFYDRVLGGGAGVGFVRWIG